MSDTIKIINHSFGWRLPIEVPQLNQRGYYSEQEMNVKYQNSREPEITKEDIELIRAHNQLDIELYEFACELFNERLREVDEKSKKRKKS